MSGKKHYSKSRIFLIFPILGLLVLLVFSYKYRVNNSQDFQSKLSEIGGQEDEMKLRAVFSKLVEEKGAVFGYQFLKQVPIRAGVNSHFLGHMAGEFLYKENGAGGMKYCTDDFGDGCAHGIVISVLSQKGLDSLSEIVNSCKEAPGNFESGYLMCIHGLGHGVLAYSDYDLEAAVKICQRAGNGEFGQREYIECIGGLTMEMTVGSGHDIATWQKQREKYMSALDPFYPCDADFILDVAWPRCYFYLTPHFFELAGVKLENPDETLFPNAFSYCNQLTDQKSKESCIWGFGKDIVFLAKGGDIRKESDTTEDELSNMNRLCLMFVLSDAQKSCLWGVVENLYWKGTNDYEPLLELCAIVKDGFGDECFERVVQRIEIYDGKAAKKDACSKIIRQKVKGCQEFAG